MAKSVVPAGVKQDLDFCRELGQQLRVDSIRSSTAAGSGHPTSSMSAADLMAVLLARHLRYDWNTPGEPNNDHLIFSKGHASPLLYAMFKAAGAVSDDEMLTYRKNGSRLEGHPTPDLPWVDVATGSLGQGLPIAVGVALACKHPEASPARTRGLGGEKCVVVAVKAPRAWSNRRHDERDAADLAERPLELARYEVGGKEATRAAYGEALTALGAARHGVVALDGEVKNSTYAE